MNSSPALCTLPIQARHQGEQVGAQHSQACRRARHDFEGPHPLLPVVDELGEGQEYQDFFTVELSGAVESSDLELVVGLDQSSTDSFVMPIKQELEVFEDPALHRQQRAGFYGWAELGFGVFFGFPCSR